MLSIIFYTIFGAFSASFLLLLLIPFYFTSIRLAIFTTDTIRIRKRIYDNGYYVVKYDGNVIGWFIASNCLGYINEETKDQKKDIKIYVCGTQKNIDLLFENNQSIIEKDSNQITIYRKPTCYYDDTYRKQQYNLPSFSLHEKQEKIIDKIIANYNETSHCVAFIHGNPGSGKSMIGSFLSKKLSAFFTKDFDPTDPNDFLHSLHEQIAPTKENPLVILLDEVDILYEKIHFDKITKFKSVRTEATNKREINSLLDDFNNNFYPNTIILMTSNKSFDYFNSLDASYLREGRVNLIFNL